MSKTVVLPQSDSPSVVASVPFWQAIRFWLKLGFISFGGPAGQIAMMHQELVDNRRWISEGRFLHALNFCMVLPGPEAQQLATYIGWLMHKTWGGVIAGVLFILPSLVLLIALAWIYLVWGDVAVVAGIFYGIKPAVAAIVLQAAHRIGSRALKNGAYWAIAAAAFVAIFALNVPFPLIVLAAALVGFIGGRLAPTIFGKADAHRAQSHPGGAAIIDDTTPIPAHAIFSWRRTSQVLIARDAAVAGADGRPDANAGLGASADPDELVLYQSRADDLWRGICRPTLCLPGGGDPLWLADGRADDGWPRPWGVDPRTVDHGGDLCRVCRRLHQSGVGRR